MIITKQVLVCSIAPHEGQSSVYELCEETGQGRWLIISSANPNQCCIDDPDPCMISATRRADASRLPYPENEKHAASLFVQCQNDQKLRGEMIFRTAGVVGGSVLDVDGFRRIVRRDAIGAAEFGLGLLTDIVAILG